MTHTDLNITNIKHPGEPAGIWRRLAALVYDCFILLAISMAYGALVLAAFVALNGAPEKNYSPVWSGPLFFVGWALSLAFFYYYFWQKGGQTMGMRAWRLKLLDWNGNIASHQSCIIRVLISPLSVGLLFFGYLWHVFDKDDLCLHDRLSKTKVVVLPKNT